MLLLFMNESISLFVQLLRKQMTHHDDGFIFCRIFLHLYYTRKAFFSRHEKLYDTTKDHERK